MCSRGNKGAACTLRQNYEGDGVGKPTTLHGKTVPECCAACTAHKGCAVFVFLPVRGLRASSSSSRVLLDCCFRLLRRQYNGLFHVRSQHLGLTARCGLLVGQRAYLYTVPSHWIQRKGRHRRGYRHPASLDQDCSPIRRLAMKDGSCSRLWSNDIVSCQVSSSICVPPSHFVGRASWQSERVRQL